MTNIYLGSNDGLQSKELHTCSGQCPAEEHPVELGSFLWNVSLTPPTSIAEMNLEPAVIPSRFSRDPVENASR